jgi:ATP-dependent helicase HepA
VRFSPGDVITHFEGWKMTVREVDDVDGLLVYHGLNAQNEVVTLPETQLSNFIQFRLASDRLFAGQIDPLAWFSLRYHTLEHTSRQLQSPLWGLGGVRAQPIAHQLHIAREVADRIAPRVLLADEVGLGKTIEAGLIIHRQLLFGASICRLRCSTKNASSKAMPATRSKTLNWRWWRWSGWWKTRRPRTHCLPRAGI